MNRFVRPSKYRHVYGTAAKRDYCYDNVRVSLNAWDTNMVQVNPLFISMNWQASGGGAFAVIPLSTVGKLPENFPLYHGHTAPVLDTDFNPFNDYIVASGSEDTKVMIWSIPEQYDEDLEEVKPVLKLSGHGRKVGHVQFHPVASNVLASASTDLSIKLWDIEKGQEKQELIGHTEIIQSMSWNYNGSLLATTCRDKRLRIFDVRSNQVVQEGPGHQGIKGSRVVWLGESNRLATTGFSKMSDRQLNLWNSDDLSKPMKSEFIDTSSGVIMPFYDNDNSILYLAGKGDRTITYYEFENDELYRLSDYRDVEAQKGVAFMPKRALNVNECEIARAYKLTTNMIEPISFKVPRKSDAFQSDIYPPAVSDEPALTADEWFAGKNADPKKIDLSAGYQAKEKQDFVPTAQAVEESKEQDSGASTPKNEKDYQKAYNELRKENDDLKKVLSQRDVKIRVLEIELEKLKTQREENKSEGSTEGNASGNDEKPAVNDQLEEQQPDKSKEDVDASPATE
ncbi:actin-binding protein [Lichtheimia corymbifera JMRC:FSU:9682]|uniref:Coronin n=1 Tax=Lichtheimia corymbifera JMRC:FSU:9682 TaxID=1263082 RepID=A0A068RSI3_9FUNG|nr:actin-binding protein [Lichtheimia corymbifera JMRC:FSU:9682]